MDLLRTLIVYIFQVLTFAIIARAILSWFNLRPDNPLVSLVHVITEPILAPLRRVLPRTGMIDLTPLIAIILLQILKQVFMVLLSA